jgi:mycothiol synthase
MSDTEVEVRRLVATDAAGLAGAVSAGQRHGEFRGSSDTEGTFIAKAFELDPSIFGGAFAEGRLMGLVSSEFKFTLVAPPWRRKGIGRRLVDLAETMERERGRPNVLMGLIPEDAIGAAFLKATGFRFHSTLWDLILPEDTAVGVATWPDDLEARAFDRTRDVDGWIALFNAAFADHATPLQLDPAFIAAGLDDPANDDADLLVLEDRASGELVGFCATAPNRTAGKISPKGEIWTIGVRPDRQGEGLGRELLRWGLARLQSLGVTEIDLSVNARNERALHLYEAEGFIRTRTRERWARPVSAVAAPPAASAGAGR